MSGVSTSEEVEKRSKDDVEEEQAQKDVTGLSPAANNVASHASEEDCDGHFYKSQTDKEIDTSDDGQLQGFSAGTRHWAVYLTL